MKYIFLLSTILLTSCMTTKGTLGGLNFKYADQTTFIVKSCIKTTNEELNTQIEFSTEDCYKNKRGYYVPSDQFVRVFKDKKTNNNIYQVYSILKYNYWTHPYSANYQVKTLKSSSGDKVFSDVSCNKYSCNHVEHFVFNIPEEDIKYIANNYNDGDLDYDFKYRIKSKSGTNIDKIIHKAEIKAIYEIVSSYKN